MLCRFEYGCELATTIRAADGGHSDVAYAAVVVPAAHAQLPPLHHEQACGPALLQRQVPNQPHTRSAYVQPRLARVAK